MSKTKETRKKNLKVKKVAKTNKSIQRPIRRNKMKAVQKPKRKGKAGNAKVLRKLQFMASQNARKGY